MIDDKDKLLSEEEQILENEKKAKFKKHLEEAAKEVVTWPEWKQNVLGKVKKGD